MKGKDSSTASILQQETKRQQRQLYAMKPKQQTTYMTMHVRITRILHQQPTRTVHEE